MGTTCHYIRHDVPRFAEGAPIAAIETHKAPPTVIAAMPVVGPAVAGALNSAPVRKTLANAGQAVAAAVKPVLAAKPEFVAREVELDSGSSFVSLLTTDSGVSSADAVSPPMPRLKGFRRAPFKRRPDGHSHFLPRRDRRDAPAALPSSPR